MVKRNETVASFKIDIFAIFETSVLFTFFLENNFAA